MPWSNLNNNDDKDNENDQKSKSSQNKKSPWETDSEPKHQRDDIFSMFKKGEDKLKEFLKDKKDNNNNKGNHLYFLLIFAIAIWLMSGFYVVDEGEQAVVLCFGKYDRTAHTGLNYHIPEPIEKIITEKVEFIRKEEIGFRASGLVNASGNKGFNNSVKSVPQESHVLTSDENILDINYVIQWRISDLRDYIFNVSNAKETVRNASESALREVVGNNKMVKTLTEGRSSVEQEARIVAQKTLDLYKSGVEITTLQMLKVDPPIEVIDAFRDVQTAKADKEREINQAQAYRNDVIPRAAGEASKVVQEGEGYKKEVEEKALGNASRFNAVYEEYLKAKNVTKDRLYFEAMEDILQGMDKIVIDSNKASSNVLPYLPLPEFNKKRVEKSNE